MRSFDNKVAVITGAASGIGQQLGIQLSAAGAFTILADVNEKGLNDTFETIKKSGGNATVHKVDVSIKEQVHLLADEVIRQHGQVDIVINNVNKLI